MKTKADVLRERGLCECGCGADAMRMILENDSRFTLWGWEKSLIGCALCTCHVFPLEEVHARVLANRAMPAEPAQESDDAWLRRVVFELTGLDCVARQDDHYIVLSNPAISHLTRGYKFSGNNGRGRSVDAVRSFLRCHNWPLKDSVTGSADAAHRETAAAAPSGSVATNSAQPVAEATCADCRAPCTGTLCIYCSLRSSPKYLDSAVAERTAALPGQVAARERVAAFERRNRPRKSATARELEREHPWGNAEDFEP